MFSYVKGMLRPILSRIKGNVMTIIGKFDFQNSANDDWRQNEPFWIFEYLNFEKIFGEFRYF